MEENDGLAILGGDISNFIKLYGESVHIQEGLAPNNEPETCLLWSIRKDLTLAIRPCYTGSGKVHSITFMYPDGWSVGELRDYMLTFAPLDNKFNSTYAGGNTLSYDSATIGKFFLHLDGSYMNIV